MTDIRILFFSRFPLDQNAMGDGEMQRVLIIDSLAKREGYIRTYVHLHFRTLQARIVKPVAMPDVEVHLLSVFNLGTWPKVIGLIQKSHIAYFHSLHNYKFAWLLGPWLRRLYTVLDLHGIVPEENLFLGKPLLSVFYSWLERRAMHRFNKFVSVSFGMIDYILGKYPWMSRDRFSLIPMIRSAVPAYDPEVEKAQRALYNLPTDVPVAIYAGNTQRWQNIDMMLDIIAHCGNRMRFIILSSAINDFEKRLHAHGIADVFLHFATPEEIHNFYSIANYGFLLREDNIVNNVANPTKLVEYLKYGIVPIVITTKTSDLELFDVEVLRAADLDDAPLNAQRSLRNIEVFVRYFCEDNYLLSKAIAFNISSTGFADSESIT